jgi:hypothetical protein
MVKAKTVGGRLRLRIVSLTSRRPRRIHPACYETRKVPLRSQGADADAARVRALAAYKDFLTLWKDADPDVPILKQAKAEYAKLQ